PEQSSRWMRHSECCNIIVAPSRKDRHECILVPWGLHQISEDRFLPQCFACLKSVQTVHEDEPLAIAADEDGSRLPDLKHALGNFPHKVRLQRRTALYRHVDVRDRKFLSFHHGPHPCSTKLLCQTSYPAFAPIAIL